MNNKCVKFLSVLSLGLFLMGTSTFGQTTPEKVSIDSKDNYYRHGFNANGANTVGSIKAEEATDSVTIGSTMKYFVLPDPAYNKDWYNVDGSIKDITNTSNIISSFTWTIETVSSGVGTTSATTPIAPINWTTSGTASIKVQEVPPGGDDVCKGTETVIPVEIIAKPTITFGLVGTAYSDGKCYLPDDVDDAAYSFPVNVSTDVKGKQDVKISYTVTKEGDASYSSGGTDVLIESGQFNVSFDDYGKYEITITKLTDRISRKSGDEGTSGFLTSGGSLSFTYTVIKPAQTGPVYHLPNSYNY